MSQPCMCFNQWEWVALARSHWLKCHMTYRGITWWEVIPQLLLYCIASFILTRFTNMRQFLIKCTLTLLSWNDTDWRFVPSVEKSTGLIYLYVGRMRLCFIFESQTKGDIKAPSLRVLNSSFLVLSLYFAATCPTFGMGKLRPGAMCCYVQPGIKSASHKTSSFSNSIMCCFVFPCLFWQSLSMLFLLCFTSCFSFPTLLLTCVLLSVLPWVVLTHLRRVKLFIWASQFE